MEKTVVAEVEEHKKENGEEHLKELLAALSTRQAFPHPTSNISSITTAASLVFLTGERAYKVNKPVNFGFLDFSTLEKRKEQCEKELDYNSLLSPELYLGVLPITKEKDGSIRVQGSGEIIEYAIMMKQMDPEATLNKRLKRGNIGASHMQRLAQKIFAFHQKAPNGEEISSFGSMPSIQFNWDENFQQTEKYQPQCIPAEDFFFLQQRVNTFIKSHVALFKKRVHQNKIKHCHGDFHSANVFVTDDDVHIFDGIVFNQRFPCSDVIAEIAFMAMDLEFHGKKELAKQFIEEYEKLSDDKDVPKLLNFYKCYRAYIRAKIACFTSEDKNLTEEKRTEMIQQAKQYFQLAKQYAAAL